ncbi:MAG: TRAP transporter large permease subunit [Xanthobacteraceae bacterium]
MRAHLVRARGRARRGVPALAAQPRQGGASRGGLRPAKPAGNCALITVPVFQPLVTKFGYDPVWFAIVVVVMVEVGLIHPPVGMNLFVIQAQAPQVKITSIYRGIIPFLIAPMILIVLMFLFPGLALWLPKLLYG